MNQSPVASYQPPASLIADTAGSRQLEAGSKR